MSITEKSVEDSVLHTKNSLEILNELQKQLDLGCSTLIPLTRTYLEELRAIRMAFSSEVSHIISSVRQLNEITKSQEQLTKLTDSITKLNSALDPKTIELLERFFKE